MEPFTINPGRNYGNNYVVVVPLGIMSMVALTNEDGALEMLSLWARFGYEAASILVNEYWFNSTYYSYIGTPTF